MSKTASLSELREMKSRGEVSGPARNAVEVNLPQGFWNDDVVVTVTIGGEEVAAETCTTKNLTSVVHRFQQIYNTVGAVIQSKPIRN